MTHFISFYNSKGGVGKSLTTNIIAHYLRNKGLKIAVVDVDDPQFTLCKRREEEIDFLTEQEKKIYEPQVHNEGLFTFYSGHTETYDLYKTSVSKGNIFLDVFKEYEKQYDIVLFDIQGTINASGITDLFKKINYFFIPSNADIEEMNPTIDLLGVFDTFLEERYRGIFPNYKGAKILFNRVNKRSKLEYISLQKDLEKLGYPFMKTYIYYSVSLYREYRSTLKINSKKNNANASFHELAEEICMFLNFN